VGFGGNWSSTEGLGGQAFWEDRNLFGGDQNLRAQITGSQTRNLAELSFGSPDILTRNLDLIASVKADSQRTSAFISQTEGGSAGLSWMMGENWRISASTAYERTLEKQLGENYNVSLLSLPIELRHDSSNSLLNPTAGDRMILTARPYLSLIGDHAAFQSLNLYATKYVEVWDKPQVVLAGWGRAGTILGAASFAIPPDKRLYVGGAGSVRGFGYQKAGPVNSGGTPLGGDSALALGAEIRIRVTHSFGVVPFIEAGRAYAQSTPDFHLPLFSGAGIGLRYFTPVGPLRADVAVPLDPRSGIDQGYQIYLSIGQAF
jgi:translocation and assembly module TamA